MEGRVVFERSRESTNMKTSTELRKELKAALIRERAERLKNGRVHPHKDWVPNPSKITREQTVILKARTTPKGFTRANLALMGVPWPPPPNWKGKLISAAVEFYQIEDIRKESKAIRSTEKLAKIQTESFAPPERKVFTRRVTSP